MLSATERAERAARLRIVFAALAQARLVAAERVLADLERLQGSRRGRDPRLEARLRDARLEFHAADAELGTYADVGPIEIGRAA